ncbi:MAG: hypothetical protein LBH53_01665 [Puniceicoccales bacterium]|jgi:hypothetical protein|nr:hypothetical protein [Puniceicoccales bacterium]
MAEGKLTGTDSFLLLDGSQSQALAAVVRLDGKRHGHWRLGRNLDGFFSSVEKTLRQEKVSWSELAGVFVNGGPGSLMGLRATKLLVDTAEALGRGVPIRFFCGPEWVARWILECDGPRSFHLLVPVSRHRHFELAVIEGKLGSLVRREGLAMAADGPTYLIPTRNDIALPVGVRWAPYPTPQFFVDWLELLQRTAGLCLFEEKC